MRERENLFSRKSEPKVILVSNLHFFSWLFGGKKRRRHYLRMIIINHNSIIENFEHFFSGLIRSAQTHFFLKWFLNIFMNYIQFKRALQQSYLKFICKVEKILKGSLDSIPSRSPSVKIQIMGRKVCLLGIVNKPFVFKSLLTTSSNVLPLHLSRP